MNRALIVIALSLALVGCSKTKPEPSKDEEKKATSALITMERAAQEHVGMKFAPAKKDKAA